MTREQWDRFFRNAFQYGSMKRVLIAPPDVTGTLYTEYPPGAARRESFQWGPFSGDVMVEIAYGLKIGVITMATLPSRTAYLVDPEAIRGWNLDTWSGVKT